MDMKRSRAKACGLYSSCLREGSVRGSRERSYGSSHSGKGRGGGSSVFSLTTEDFAPHVYLTDFN